MKKLLIIMAVLMSINAMAFERELSSGSQQTQVIELYTSEGCSSCPPADNYFTQLKKQQGLWKKFVPIAFHVDYWDYIGWKDEFAQKNNSIRQQVHKIIGNTHSVYTPQMIKAGKEWRAWRFAQIEQSPIEVGILKISIHGNKLKARFPSKNKSYNLTIALLGMNISSMVNAGENKGHYLRHDFVVLKQDMYLSKNGQWDVELSPDFFTSKHKSLAFVAWVETEENPAPIQAVGTFL